MSLALEMFAVAPSGGSANLSEAQRSLLAGKARWIRAAWEAGADTFVAGTAIFGAPDPAGAVDDLRRACGARA